VTRPPAGIGAAVEAIDTPAFVVRFDAYERNLDRMNDRVEALWPVAARGAVDWQGD
jgi:D-serine deaminase-like pyridoxal phosphate-dependent protein